MRMTTRGVANWVSLLVLLCGGTTHGQGQTIECGTCLFRLATPCQNEDATEIAKEALQSGLFDCASNWEPECINALIDSGACNRLEKLNNNEKYDVEGALEDGSDLSFYIDVPAHSSEVLFEVYSDSDTTEGVQIALQVDAVHSGITLATEVNPFCEELSHSGYYYVLCSFVDAFEPSYFTDSDFSLGSDSTLLATRFVARISLKQGDAVEKLVVLASYRVCNEINLDGSLPERDSREDFKDESQEAYFAVRWTPSWDLSQTQHVRSISLRYDYFHLIEDVAVFGHDEERNRPDVDVVHPVNSKSLNFDGRFTTFSMEVPIAVSEKENTTLWIAARGLVLLLEDRLQATDTSSVIRTEPITGNPQPLGDVKWTEFDDVGYSLPFKVCAAPEEPRSCAACLDPTGEVGCPSNPLISSCVCQDSQLGGLGMPECCSQAKGGWTGECIDAFLSVNRGEFQTTCAFDYCTEGGVYVSSVEAVCDGGTGPPHDQSAVALVNRHCRLLSGQCVYPVDLQTFPDLCGGTGMDSIIVEYNCGPASTRRIELSADDTRRSDETVFENSLSWLLTFDCSGIHVHHAVIGQECDSQLVRHHDAHAECNDKFRCDISDDEGGDLVCSQVLVAYEVRYFCGGDPTVRSHFEIGYDSEFEFTLQCELPELVSNVPTNIPSLLETVSIYYQFTVPLDANYVLLETKGTSDTTGQVQIVALAFGGRPDNSGATQYSGRPDACEGGIEYVHSAGSNFNVCPVTSPPDGGFWVVRVTAREIGENFQNAELTLNVHYCNDFLSAQRAGGAQVSDPNVVAGSFAGTWTAPDNGFVTTIELEIEFYTSISMVSVHENFVSTVNANFPGERLATSGEVTGNGQVWTVSFAPPIEVASGKLYWVALSGDVLRTEGTVTYAQQVLEAKDTVLADVDWQTSTLQADDRVLTFVVCYGYPEVEDCGNCDTNSGVPGCSSADIVECVCSVEEGCCGKEWESGQCLDAFFDVREELCPEAARLCARPGIHVVESLFQCNVLGTLPALLSETTSQPLSAQGGVSEATRKSVDLLQVESVRGMCDGMVECEFDVVESLADDALPTEFCTLSTEYVCSEAMEADFFKTSDDVLDSIALLDCYGFNVFSLTYGICDFTEPLFDICGSRQTFVCEFTISEMLTGSSCAGTDFHLTYTCGADLRRTEYIVDNQSEDELLSFSCPLPPSPAPTPSPTNFATVPLTNDVPLTNVRFAPTFSQREFSFQFLPIGDVINEFEVFIYPANPVGSFPDILLEILDSDGNPLTDHIQPRSFEFPASGAALYRAKDIFDFVNSFVNSSYGIRLSTDSTDVFTEYVVHMKYESCESTNNGNAAVEVPEPELMTVALRYDNGEANPNLIRRLILNRNIGEANDQLQFERVFDVMLFPADANGNIDLKTPLAPCGSFGISRVDGDWHVDTRTASYDAEALSIWIVVYGSIALPRYADRTGLSNITTLYERTSLSACEPNFPNAVQETVDWSVGLCVGGVFERGCGDCHVAHDEPFCSNHDLLECVCNNDFMPECCQTGPLGSGWNTTCVDTLFQAQEISHCGDTFGQCVDELTEGNRDGGGVCDPNVLDEMCPDHNALCDAQSAELRWMRCGVARDYVLSSVADIGDDEDGELPLCGTIDRCWVDLFGSTDEIGFEEYRTMLNCFGCCFRHELDNTFTVTSGVCEAFPISPCCDATVYNPALIGNVVGNACRLQCNQGEPCGAYESQTPIDAQCDDLLEPACEDCCLDHEQWECARNERENCEVCDAVNGFQFLGTPFRTDFSVSAPLPEALVSDCVSDDECAGLTFDRQSGTLSFYSYGSGYEKTDDQMIQSIHINCPNDLIPSCKSALSSLDRCPLGMLAPQCRNADNTSLYAVCKDMPECYDVYESLAAAGGLAEATCMDAESCFYEFHGESTEGVGYQEFVDLYLCWQCCTHNKPIDNGICQGRNGLAGLFNYTSPSLSANARVACESAYPDAVLSPTVGSVCTTQACDDCGEQSYHLHTDPTCFNETGTGFYWNSMNTSADLSCGWEPCDEVLVSYNGGLDWCSSCFDLPCEELTPSPTMGPTPSPTLSPAVECRLGNAGAQIMCEFNFAINFQPSVGQFSAETLCERVLFGTEREIQSLYGAGHLCAYQSVGMLTIRFGQESTIESGAQIAFLIGPERSDDSSVSTAILEPARNPTVPIAKISGPSITSTCADLRLNGLQSTGAAGRAFAEVIWNLAAPINSVTDGLQLLIQGQSQAELVIDAAALIPDLNLNISLQVVNWLGESSVTFHTVAVSAESIPTVTGTSPIVAQATTFVYLRANVDLDCNDTTVRAYQWRALTELEATPDGFEPTRTLELTPRQISSGTVLRIFPDTLQPSERYAFELEVRSNTGDIGRGYFGVEVSGPAVFAVSSTSRSVCIGQGCPDLEFRSADQFRFSSTSLAARAEYFWRCTYVDAEDVDSGVGRDCFPEETSEALFGPREVCEQSHSSLEGIVTPTETPPSGTEAVVALEWTTPDSFVDPVASADDGLHTLKQLQFPTNILTSFARVGLFADSSGTPRQQLTCSDRVVTAGSFHTVTFDVQVELEPGLRYWIVLTQALIKNATVDASVTPIQEASRMYRIYNQPTLNSDDGDTLCEVSSWDADLNSNAVRETEFVLPVRFCTDAPLPQESRTNVSIPQSVLGSSIPGGTLTFFVFVGDSILEEFPRVATAVDLPVNLPVAEWSVTATRTTIVVPQVVIIPLAVRKVSVNSRIALEVLVEYDGDFDDLFFQWNSLSNNFDLANTDLLLSEATSQHLVFRPDSLDPGVEYQFEVVVFVGTAGRDGTEVSLLQDSTNSASATISFVTNYPPTGGTCELRVGGSPLRAPYTFACSGWTDDRDDLPLEYRFFLNPGRPRQILLSQWSPLSDVQALLPPGNHTIEAQIRDNLGAATSSEIQLSIPRIDFEDSGTTGNTATEFASDVVSQLLALGESRSNSTEDRRLLSLNGVRLLQEGERAVTSEEGVQLIVGVADLLSENPTSAAGQSSTRSGLRNVMFSVLDQIVFEPDTTRDSVGTGEDDTSSQTSDELEQFLQAAAALSGTPSELEALRQSLPDFLERTLNVALNGTFAVDGVTDGIADSALKTLSQSGSAPYNETIEEALAFTTTFDDVVYQIARGRLKDTFAGEVGSTVESGGIRLFSRRTRADQIDGRVSLGTGNSTSDGFGSAIVIPTETIFANANLINGSRSTVDFTFLSYKETVFPTTRNPSDAKGDEGVEFDLLRNQIGALASISETIQVNYYDTDADIDTDEKGEHDVSDLDACDPIQILIQHDDVVADDNVVSLANFDSDGEGPVCRHWNENSSELLSDCVRHNFTREYTVCNCTHLTFFDVAGFGDFVPSANRLTEDDFKAVSIETLRKHPSGWIGLSMATGLFLLLLAWATYRDWRVYKEAMKKKRGEKPLKMLKKKKTTLIGSKLVRDDDYQWVICHDERLSRPQKLRKVWTFRLRNKHKWVGMFLHKKRSRFQTKERATVLYVYVMSTLAIGAVFHGQKENVADYISIGLISSLFALVPSLLCSQLFMNSRSRLQTKAFGMKTQNVRKSNGGMPLSHLEDVGGGLASIEEVSIDGAPPAKLAKGGSEVRVAVEMASFEDPKKKTKPCKLTKEDLLSNMDALTDGGRPPKCLTPGCEFGVIGAHPCAAEEAQMYKKGFFTILFSGILDSEMPPADDTDENSSGKRDDSDPNSDSDDTKGTFSPRMKKYTYAFSFIWSLGCAVLVLVYSIQFDRAIVTFYTQCGQQDLIESRIVDWGYSIAVANFTDIFISQPFSLLLLSIFAVIKSEVRGATEEELEAAAAAANRRRVSTSSAVQKKATGGGGGMGVSASTLPPPINENAEYLSDLDSEREYSKSLMDSKEDNESNDGEEHRKSIEISRSHHERTRRSLDPVGARAPGRHSVSRESRRGRRRSSRSRSRSPHARFPPSSGVIAADGRVRISTAPSRQSTLSVERRSRRDPAGRASLSRSRQVTRPSRSPSPQVTQPSRSPSPQVTQPSRSPSPQVTLSRSASRSSEEEEFDC